MSWCGKFNLSCKIQNKRNSIIILSIRKECNDPFVHVFSSDYFNYFGSIIFSRWLKFIIMVCKLGVIYISRGTLYKNWTDLGILSQLPFDRLLNSSLLPFAGLMLHLALLQNIYYKYILFSIHGWFLHKYRLSCQFWVYM
jgi:hypothetical protein